MTSDKVAQVLVVDDEPDVRELLADALGSRDMEITTAASAREAIDQAARRRPDMLIMDMCLGGDSGLDVIDRVRERSGDVPAVVITGLRDAAALAAASRRRPVELMTKPLDLDRLRTTVRGELDRCRHRDDRLHQRARRLRRIARDMNFQRRSAQGKLQTTCADLTCAYRTLSGQLTLQNAVIGYQNSLIAAQNDDHVFAGLFRLFAGRTGPLYGVAMVCDDMAHLNIIGRFGVPKPDDLPFCTRLSAPLVEMVLASPKCTILDAGDRAELFDPAIARRLPGLTILAVPLVPSPGELIGLAVLYRKGEQPFTDADLGLAEMIALPTATAVRRTD